MKRSLLHRCLSVATVAGAAGAILLTSTPAYAGTPVLVSAAGSDTTQDVMGDYLATQNATSTVYNGTTYDVTTKNIPAFSTSAFATPAETNCPATSWVKDTLAPTAVTTPTLGIAPFGSGAGRDYLNYEQQTALAGQKGCVDIARSSSGKRTDGTTNGTDPAGAEYYAFAMDTVSWATTSLKAPATLTLAQLQGIYNCTITNWDQVGGTTGAITPYLPQPGSGTRSFFLGSTGFSIPTPSALCVPASREIEENQAKTVAVADIDSAIMPYSAALWNYQQSNRANPTIDKRNGARLGGYTTGAAVPVKATPSQWVAGDNQYEMATTPLIGFLGLPASYAVVSETNISVATPAFSGTNDYRGVRYVYNVVNSGGPVSSYEAAKALVGFDTVGPFKSAMCSGGGSSSIQTFGMATLDTTNPNALNPTASTCRKV